MDITAIIIAIIAEISVVISAVLGFIASKKQVKKEDHKKEVVNQTETILKRLEIAEKGVQAVLRDRLYAEHARLVNKNYATYEEKENFNNMYQNYEALGEDGIMKHIYEDINNLKAFPKNKEDK